MSRYLLLFLLNLPFIFVSILDVITQFKLNRINKRRFIFRLGLWLIILAGLFLAQPIYVWLFNNKLTDTEPLSLFDVVEITAIVIVFYIANRARNKSEILERQIKDLHQELSIRHSQKN